MSFTVPISGRVDHRNLMTTRYGAPITQVVLSFGSIKEEQNPNKKKSSNYLIARGRIYGQVDENFTTADRNQISVKIQNGSKTTSPLEGVAQEDFNALSFLIATVASAQNWGAVARSNITFQHDYVEEDEEVVFDDNGDIVEREGYINYAEAGVAVADAAHRVYCQIQKLPNVEAPHTPPVDNKTTWQLADEAMTGVYGFGDFRELALGTTRDSVVTEVLRRDGYASTGESLDVGSKSIEQMTDEYLRLKQTHLDVPSLTELFGDHIEEVFDRVDYLVREDKDGNSIASLANAVLRSNTDNEKVLRVNLGVRYDSVMAEVARRKEEVTNVDDFDAGTEYSDNDQEASGD